MLKEIETRRRIRLALWAYAYEFENHSIVSDALFDMESYCVDLNVETNRIDLDYFFKAYFQPCTGLWIYKHPELYKVKNLYNWQYDKNQNSRNSWTLGELNRRLK